VLQPAHVGHLALLRTLIRQGAADGSFDRELASDTPAAEEFFAKLKRALVTGYFVEESRTGKLDRIAVPGYVFWPDNRNTASPPVGFGIFRALDTGGYELWLAGLDLALRGGGQGKAMLNALFATPHGRTTFVVRVQRESRHVQRLQQILEEAGFALVGDTARLRWFVHRSAPPVLAARVRDAVFGHAAQN
jgi:hypothetical protein